MWLLTMTKLNKQSLLEVKRLQYEECAPMANNQRVISYVNGCNIEEVDEEVFVIKH